MAAYLLTSPELVVGSADLTPYSNQVTFGPISAEVKDATTFASGGYTINVPGLRSAPFNVSGYQDFAASALETTLGGSFLGSQVPVSLGTANTAAAPAYLLRGNVTGFTPWAGSVGDLAGFSFDVASDTIVTSGQVAHALGAETATANGTILTMTGPAATQRMYAALHVTAISGTATPTLTATVQSAATVGFGSPTSRISFTAATAVGSQWSSVAGAVTDGYWRVIWTISGTNPSITFFITLGVGPA